MYKRLAYVIALIIPLALLNCAKKEIKVVEEEPIVGEIIEIVEEEEPEEEVKIPFILSRIHFDYDKYDVRPEDAKILEKNVEVLKVYPDARVIIEGHCDERGTNEYNLALGEKRANSAKDYLIMLGISKDRMSTISYGEEKPFDLGHNEIAWSKNRRTEFVRK